MTDVAYKVCLKMKGESPDCYQGSGWVHDECWRYAEDVQVQRKTSSGNWAKVKDARVLKDSSECGDKYPYLSTATLPNQTPGVNTYRFVALETADYAESPSEPFTVTITPVN